MAPLTPRASPRVPVRFGNARHLFGRHRRALHMGRRRFIDKVNQEKLFAVAVNRLHDDAERYGLAAMKRLAARNDGARSILTCLLDSRAKLVAHDIVDHGEQVMRRLSGRNAQIPFRRTEGIEAFMLAIDQHRRRRISIDDQALAKLGQAPFGAPMPGWDPAPGTRERSNRRPSKNRIPRRGHDPRGDKAVRL